MQKQTNSKRYLFQADALGVAGQLTHPFCEPIPVQAASVVPIDGGFAASRVQSYRHQEILSFSAAYTEVVGSEPQDGVYESVVLSVVENFNLLDVVTCDRIVARLTSRISIANETESFVLPVGSRFEGLRIGNRHFDRLEFAPEYFCRLDRASWSGLLKGLESSEERTHLHRLSLPSPDGHPISFEAAGQRTRILGFCLAPESLLNLLGPPLSLAVPGFGTVHLGEYFCYPNTRSLTMLRVQLGCPVGGKVVAAAVQGGGEPYP